ncbi:flavin reductase [Caulobacter segnis]|uniref:Flavin reductase domain protein FMN-binding protein n=2 Tax=Caulobacter segnis TaxID=88688 RepID=D5VGR3_CAUST|nr:flavin reductase family protein [Caulobacter segnis]ADG10506.1 flavin reductase domain protein FMN-binding protein [Caulobacter segnis ATCC 21756]AVQ02230.1 flavin reductase [Caulobacter segnis]
MAYDAASPSRSAAPVQADFPKQADFKEVLAHLAGGVAIISCWDEDTPRGLLVSSITGLSVKPPRFLFCVRKEAGCHDALVGATECGVTLLSADDQDEAWRYASSARASERFSPERWRLSPEAPPAYRGGLASARCVIDSIADAGTHSILIVTATESSLSPAQPLVAWNRGFL